MGLDHTLPIWFDWQDGTISLALPQNLREVLTTEQSRALDEACRVLSLTIKDSPPSDAETLIQHEELPSGSNNQCSDVSDTFGRYFRENKWGSTETVSGRGSTLLQTQSLRWMLPILFAELGVTSLLDLPCGDFHWMRYMPLEDKTKYLGADVVREIVERNQHLVGSERVCFICLDILSDRIPSVDLILCRDCLVHLPNAEIRNALENLCRSGSQWLLTTTFPGRRTTPDIAVGKWRPLNLQAPPFSLPPPVTLIVEQCTEGTGRYADKSLGLWHLRDVATALGLVLHRSEGII